MDRARSGSIAPPVRIAVTLGDPRGIGPEVMVRASEMLLAERPDVRLSFLGDGGAGSAGGTVRSSFPHPVPGDFESTGTFDGSESSAGRVTVGALERGVAMALAGRVSALVTGPVSKPALHAAGARYPGQTEFLMARTGVPRVGMLMAAESSRAGVPLRVLLVTTHLPLRDVPVALTEARIVSQVELLHASMQEGWSIPNPRIALCALNPHASDDGLFGDEESRVMAPAVAALRARGIRLDGPFPADTVFLRLLRGEADVVAVPYHDVGMAVFKTLAFGAGVNVTLGLPFVRTSPDHGTAFDLAGTGRADPTSALEALRLALRITEARQVASSSGAAGPGPE